MRREKGGRRRRREQPFNKEEKQQHPHQSKHPLWAMGEKEKVWEELNDGERRSEAVNNSTSTRGEWG
jgi:hypothetical protein